MEKIESIEFQFEDGTYKHFHFRAPYAGDGQVMISEWDGKKFSDGFLSKSEAIKEIKKIANSLEGGK